MVELETLHKARILISVTASKNRTCGIKTFSSRFLSRSTTPTSLPPSSTLCPHNHRKSPLSTFPPLSPSSLTTRTHHQTRWHRTSTLSISASTLSSRNPVTSSLTASSITKPSRTTRSTISGHSRVSRRRSRHGSRSESRRTSSAHSRSSPHSTRTNGRSCSSCHRNRAV